MYHFHTANFRIPVAIIVCFLFLQYTFANPDETLLVPKGKQIIPVLFIPRRVILDVFTF